MEGLGTGRGHRVLRVFRRSGKIQALALPAPRAPVGSTPTWPAGTTWLWRSVPFLRWEA